MKNVNVGNDHDPIKQTSSLSPWRVLYLPYPPETVESTHIQVEWTPHSKIGKIKLPRISLKKKSAAKQGSSVNYDLLCRELERILNKEEAEGYELISMQPTHSGSYCVTTIAKPPYANFLKVKTPSHHLQGKEALMLIFKKRSTP